MKTGSINTWKISKTRALTLDQSRLMGILNVTPDSFFDGGRFADVGCALEHALSMIEDGADVIDIGGESTRPGAKRVEAQEQIRRTIPVIESIRAHTPTPISIDTTLASVAEAALNAGANIINDVSAGVEDAHLFTLAAKHECGLILMHRRVPPDQDSYSQLYHDKPHDGDVVAVVGDFLRKRCFVAQAAGVQHDQIVIDPGLGFGKSVEQNYDLIANAEAFLATGYPLLCAASRKSFVGAVAMTSEAENRLSGSVAISVSQFFAGVRLFRVHDVAAHCQALAVAAEIERSPHAVVETQPGVATM